MRTTTMRPATAEERARLEALLHPVPRRNPGKLLGIFLGAPIGFTTLALLNVLLPVPAFVRLAVAVAAGAGAATLLGRWAAARHASMLRPPREVEEVLGKDLAEGRVAVTRYDVEEVVKVAPDPGRFVRTTWFLRLADGAVVLLVGPHLEGAEEAGEFPSTAFEIAAGESSGYVLSVKGAGERLAPVVVRAPLSDAEWEGVGDDDETVPLTWTEVLENARRNPYRSAREGSAGAPAVGPGEAPGDPTRTR